MDTESWPHGAGPLVQKTVFAVALAMACTAIANSMPNVWIFPRIGPLANEVIRNQVAERLGLPRSY